MFLIMTNDLHLISVISTKFYKVLVSIYISIAQVTRLKELRHLQCQGRNV